MGLALMDRLDSCSCPEFGATWQGHGASQAYGAQSGGFIEKPCREGWYFYTRYGLQPIK